MEELPSESDNILEPTAIIGPDGQRQLPNPPEEPAIQVTDKGIGFNLNRLPEARTITRIVAGLGIVGVAAGIMSHDTALGAASAGVVLGIGEIKLVRVIASRPSKNDRKPKQ